MSLFEQTYNNNIRTISGLINVPFQDDSVLECDTSTGAVGVQLQDIPANKWNTIWKLYIVDKSGNASVNNITVTAPAGYLINGVSSFVINSNNATLIIRVSSNTNYAGQYSATILGSGYNLIEDEGTPLPARTTLNFVGGAVTVTDSGGKTIVTISGGGLISLTNAQMSNLINTSTVSVGQFYLITDAGFTDGGVIVQGTTTNSVTINGSGIFYNADYQAIGNYSGVAGFNSALGLWSIVPQAVVIGDCVVYDNQNYKNLTGVWGTAPSSDAVNWQLLPKSSTTGYIIAIDRVKYDVGLSVITYREDVLGNEVDLVISGGNNSLINFQWGRGLACIGNKVLSGGIMNCTNSYAVFQFNTVIGGGSTISDSTSKKDFGEVKNNIIEAQGELILTETKGKVNKNYISQSSDGINSQLIVPSILLGGELRNNRITTGSVMTINSIEGTVDSNILNTRSTITIGNVVSGSEILKNELNNFGSLVITATTLANNVIGCNISDNNIVDLATVTTNYSNYTIFRGYSNWEYDLDFDTVGVHAGLILTIPPILSYVGIFNAVNSLGKNTAQIVNPPSNHEFTIIPTGTPVGNIFRINYPIPSVAVAVANDIIELQNQYSASVFDYNITYRANGCDYAVFKKLGNLVGLIERNVFR